MDRRPPVVLVDNADGLRTALEQALQHTGYTLVCRDADKTIDGLSRKILLEFPSDLALLESITEYVITRIEQAWSLPARSCPTLEVALSESLINAVKHGNHSDPSRLVRFTIDVSDDEARFAVEDEGVGFDPANIPHPHDPENLFKSSGRGVQMIRNLMDSTQYSQRGNQVIMIKRRANWFHPATRPVEVE
jgi:serine/threonine-protein kinase RsbW